MEGWVRLVKAISLRTFGTVNHEQDPILRSLDHAGIKPNHHTWFDQRVVQNFTDCTSFSSADDGRVL